jgi:RNA polymerase sigma factor for flagellar operon FliA
MLAENEISTEEVWELYERTRAVEFRNELVLRYSGLVRSIVRRVASVSGDYADAEDLASYGMLGLIQAIEKFDLSKGVAFETFAVYRIRGEAIDYIRRNDWVPRGVRKRALEYENAVGGLTGELGRRPTEEELAHRLGVGSGDLKMLYSGIERFNVISFEELVQGVGQTDKGFADPETPEGVLQEEELLKILTAAIDDMPEREKLIITLYYYEELTLREVSHVLGVSEARVSQLHSRAIGRMKTVLKEYLDS